MKIDELIEILIQAKANHGNIEVITFDESRMTDYFTVDKAEVSTIKGSYIGNELVFDDEKYLVIS